MGILYGTFVTRDIPCVYAVSADELYPEDIFRLENIHHVNREDFVIVKRSRECIILNESLGDNLKEIEDIINKVMMSKYIPEKLISRFRNLTDSTSSCILQLYYLDWREQLRKRELYRQAISMLKSAKSLRISWKVKRNAKMIREVFNIGYGMYDEKAICDYQKGAENAFMYGYLLGVQSQKGGKE